MDVICTGVIIPRREFWDCGRWKSYSLWNFSIVGPQWLVWEVWQILGDGVRTDLQKCTSCNRAPPPQQSHTYRGPSARQPKSDNLLQPVRFCKSVLTPSPKICQTSQTNHCPWCCQWTVNCLLGTIILIVYLSLLKLTLREGGAQENLNSAAESCLPSPLHGTKITNPPLFHRQKSLSPRPCLPFPKKLGWMHISGEEKLVIPLFAEKS